MDMPSIIHTILEGKWILNSGASYHITKIGAFLKDCSLRQTKSIQGNKDALSEEKTKKGEFPKPSRKRGVLLVYSP
jgi:hypothetical protein